LRDWAVQPALVSIDEPGDIFALGDVHGDYDRLVDLLLAGHILSGVPDKPARARWSAGNAVLVCTGDLIDKGNQSIKVIELFKAIQTDAASSGGRVVVTMGNHEAEFLADPAHDQKASEFRAELEAKGLDPAEVAAGRDAHGLGTFLRGLPFAARVGDWFFAHAGNTRGLTFQQLDSALRKGLDDDGFRSNTLIAHDSLLEARLHPAPFWEQSGDRRGEGEARLRRFVEALGVKHLVVGHQPEKVEFDDGTKRRKGEAFQKFDGLVFLIDVGMSRAIDDSRGALLRLQGGDTSSATIIFPDGRSERLWPCAKKLGKGG